MGSWDERGVGLSGVSRNSCSDGDRFAPVVSIFVWIASNSRNEDEGEDDRGVNGLNGGDGSRRLSVNDDFGSTIASECEFSSWRGPVWGLNEIDHQYHVEEKQKVNALFDGRGHVTVLYL